MAGALPLCHRRSRLNSARIGFEDVVSTSSAVICSTLSNTSRYAGQRIFVVRRDDYVCP
jgi:hypothetical protein